MVTDEHAALLDNLSAAITNWACYVSGLGSIEVQLNINPFSTGATTAIPGNIPIGELGEKTLVRDSVPYEPTG